MKLFEIEYNKKFPFIHISKNSLYGIIIEALLIGFVGFILESLFEYCFFEGFMDRGFLCGPFVPLYAFLITGICLYNYFPKPSFKNFITLSVYMFLLITILEEIVGATTEYLFNDYLWTYEDIPLSSYSNYTNVFVSLFWGVGGALYILYIIPFIYKLTLKINNRIKLSIIILSLSVLLIDLIYTLYRVHKYNGHTELYEFEPSLYFTLLIIGVFLYLLLSIPFMIFISKYICKINNKLDSLMVFISSYIIFIPFFSMFDYLERTGVKQLEFLAVLGYWDIAVLLYFFLSILLMMFIFFIYRIILKYIKNKDKYNIFKYKIFKPIIIISSFILGILVVIGGVISVKNPEVTNLKIGSGDNEMKIVAVSDIHYKTTGSIIDLNDLAKDINKLKPDLVLFLGDTVDNYVSNKDNHKSINYIKFSKAMNKIESTYGIYNISGNHEFEINDVEEVNDFFGKVSALCPNFHNLDDECILINDQIRLLGRRDYLYGGENDNRESIENILKKSNLFDSDLPLIVLDHQPQDYKESMKANATLQLSGHTHNGQIFPGNIIVNLYHKIRYDCISDGKYKKDDFTLYITRGYGTWGFPLRTTGRSEILNIKFKY